MLAVALLAEKIDMGSRKGLDSIGFGENQRTEGANGFWPQGERTGSRPNVQEYVATTNYRIARGAKLSRFSWISLEPHKLYPQ